MNAGVLIFAVVAFVWLVFVKKSEARDRMSNMRTYVDTQERCTWQGGHYRRVYEGDTLIAVRCSCCGTDLTKELRAGQFAVGPARVLVDGHVVKVRDFSISAVEPPHAKVDRNGELKEVRDVRFT